MLNKAQLAYCWMAALFLTCLIIANLMGSMLFSFRWGSETVLLSAGIIPFPITFLLTDLLNEFFGKSGARFVTLLGFAMSILVYGFLVIGEQLPVDPLSQFTHAQFAHFSGLYTGMFAASLAAYLVSQLLDIQVFHGFRRITQHRYIWLRATGSTVISQLFDSLLVTFIAFWGDHPPDILLKIALGNYTWKFLVAVGITPLLYVGHAVLRRTIGWQETLTERLEPAYHTPAGSQENP